MVSKREKERGREVEVEKEKGERREERDAARWRDQSNDSAVFSSTKPVVVHSALSNAFPVSEASGVPPFSPSLCASLSKRTSSPEGEEKQESKRRCLSLLPFFLLNISHLPVPPSPTSTSLKEGTPSGVTWPGRAWRMELKRGGERESERVSGGHDSIEQAAIEERRRVSEGESKRLIRGTPSRSFCHVEPVTARRQSQPWRRTHHGC